MKNKKKNKKRIIIKKNGDIVGKKCFAYFGGKDGRGTCNIKCQWWRNEYLDKDNEGCVMWKKHLTKGGETR
jgi:hypothetical protein